MIATRALRNSRMINNGEGQGELSLKNRERERERIEALSREIWGRESGETGTRIINDLERQVFADNRLELLRLAFHILFFLSFEEFRIPRIVVELTNEIRTLWHGKIYWTSSKGISSGRKGVGCTRLFITNRYEPSAVEFFTCSSVARAKRYLRIYEANVTKTMKWKRKEGDWTNYGSRCDK